MNFQIRIVSILYVCLLFVVPGVASAGMVNDSTRTSNAAGLGLTQSPSSVGGVPVYPVDDIWNVPVDKLPVDPA